MGERAWAGTPSWGIWSVPESELEMLPADMTGETGLVVDDFREPKPSKGEAR